MWWIILAIIAVIVIWVVGTYNSLVHAKQNLEQAWSEIDNQLKRRFDLIPNLVETVKGYAAHEKSTLEEVIKARNAYLSAGGSVDEKINAENALTSGLRQLFALSENYPELKANANFRDLQVELTGTEDKIAYARQYYNTSAREYNAKLLTFPNNIIASMFKANFTEAKYFEAASEERENVKVQF
jgi:LemA protein